MNKQIICSNLKCKHHSQAGTCRCGTIVLTLNGVHTQNQGYQDFLKCSRYEEDKEYKRLRKKVEKMLGVNNDGLK